MQMDDVILICDELREQIYGFRKFRDAKWTVSEDYIDKLEMLFHKILPDSIKQYGILFPILKGTIRILNMNGK